MENRVTRSLQSVKRDLQKSQPRDGFDLMQIVDDQVLAFEISELCRMFLNMAVPDGHHDTTFYYYIERRVENKDKVSALHALVDKAIVLSRERVDAEEAEYLETV